MNEIIICGADVTDAPALLEIYSYYVEKTAVSFEWETPSLDEFRRRMEGVMKRYPYFKATLDGKAIGYAYAHEFIGRRAYDWSAELTIYLDKDHRGMGAGRALYTALENTLVKMGVTNVYACIGVTDREDEYLTNASLAFHNKMGFTPVGTFRSCGRKFGRWYDMVWAEKIIGEHLDDQPEVINAATK